ncbi:MAG: uL15 family ribosomal protein [Patescibacteria group bacterium]
MQLHEIRSNFKKRSRKRVGRGGKRGTTSGRGTKGQKSRAGRRIRPAERDLILKLPKRRGFANLPKSDKPLIFNLGDLSSKIKTHSPSGGSLVINREFLESAGLLPKNWRGRVKILGKGEINVPIVLEGIDISGNAKLKVEKAGGSIKQK